MCTLFFYFLAVGAVSHLEDVEPFAKISAPTCEEARLKADQWVFFPRPTEVLARKDVQGEPG